jgi:hypothetical protein
LRKLIREPFLHFLVLGGALFFLYNVTGNRDEPQSAKIVVTSGKIDQIITTFSRTWQRPPSPEELQRLVEDDIREEVLYREAMAMGLNKDDTIVRRRLRQKYEFVMEDAETIPAPSDQDLQTWLNQNPEEARVAPKFSFSQVYLNLNRRGDKAFAEATSLLSHLNNSGEKIDASTLGDPTMLPAEFPLSSKDEIANVFGNQFVQQLEQLKPGRWAGPLQSSYGLSLVYVRERIEGSDKSLQEVRDQAQRMWMAVRRRELTETAYQKLREKYSVVIETEQSRSTTSPRSGESTPKGQGQ